MTITVRIYVRASTKDQNAERALEDLTTFSETISDRHVTYIENYSGTKLDRPQLNRLLEEAEQGDVLLVESVDRLSRLTQENFEILKTRIKEKGLRLVVADLPTSYIQFESQGEITSSILNFLNNMLIDLLATMARLDNEKRIERIKQGMAKAGYKPKGKTKNTAKHTRILELIKTGALTKEEVAKAVGVSESTVYRAIRSEEPTAEAQQV
ncbi:TPA: recombinase family protein [Acinetobacter baumannii]|uniref:recombinase family protein n=1 Tax=Acinetobacter baumannii TaxID=470 RepID=UPI00338D8B7D